MIKTDAARSATADKAAPTFTFDEVTHTYRLDGRAIPNVTRVLGDLGIIDPRWFTEEARLRGQRVHVATHFLDEGDLDWSTITPEAFDGMEIRGYVRAWERFKRETRCEIIDIEQRRFDPVHLFAGTRDRRLRWNGRRWKIDIKTVGTPGASGPRGARYQTGAYDILEPSDTDQPDKRAAILLYPNETWLPDFHDDFYDGQKFLAMLTTFRCRREVGIKSALGGDNGD